MCCATECIRAIFDEFGINFSLFPTIVVISYDAYFRTFNNSLRLVIEVVRSKNRRQNAQPTGFLRSPSKITSDRWIWFHLILVVVYVALESVSDLHKMLGRSLIIVPRIPFEPGGNSHRGVGQRRNGTVQTLQNRRKVDLAGVESQVAAETKTIRPGIYPFQVRLSQL